MTSLTSAQLDLGQACPYFPIRVLAGFPLAVEDHLEEAQDLKELLVRRPASTYFVRVRGDSMVGAGILDGSILVVDCSLEPRHYDVVIAVVDGDMTVKRLVQTTHRWELHPANPVYPVLALHADQSWDCWGVVTGAVHQLPRH